MLAGAGDRAFCTGGDQSAHDGNYDGRGTIGLPMEELHTAIRDVPKPVIARVQGFAIGGEWSGAALVATEAVRLGPGERALVGTGVRIALPDGYAAFVVPRSGLAAKHGITIVNAPGTVDAGYRGEIKVALAQRGHRLEQRLLGAAAHLADQAAEAIDILVEGLDGMIIHDCHLLRPSSARTYP